ncbi:MAG: outer membrane beta-barrel protein [Gemmatimonadaceae bacterium]
MKRLMLALATVVCALPAAAQRSTHVGVGVGGVIPSGTFGDTRSAGPMGLITLATGPADSPIGARLDYSYNDFRGRTVGVIKSPDSHLNAVTANIVLAGRVAGLKPYVIGGLGWYPYREGGDSVRTNAFGPNAGGGIGFQLPYSQLGGFIEARYHKAHAPHHVDRRFIPITIGILF